MLVRTLIGAAIALPGLPDICEIGYQLGANAAAESGEFGRSEDALNAETLKGIKIFTLYGIRDDCLYKALPVIFGQQSQLMQADG